MTKSELIERIVTHQGQLSAKDVELAIKTMLEQMSQALATGDRIEIRGFGSFSLHYRAPRVGRNPKTGESVRLDGKFVPHFKPGKELRIGSTSRSDSGRYEVFSMQWLGRILTAVFVLVVALVVLVFVLENQNSVSLAFLGWHTPDGPLSLFVSLAFILGGLGGLLSGALLRLRGRRQKSLRSESTSL